MDAGGSLRHRQSASLYNLERDEANAREGGAIAGILIAFLVGVPSMAGKNKKQIRGGTHRGTALTHKAETSGSTF